MAFTASDFKEIGVIGRGQYGTCVLAVHKSTGERVVIKKALLAASSAAAAEGEVALLARLQHPSIVSYYGSFMHEGALHIVMEHCERGDLAATIKASRSTRTYLAEDVILDWFCQLLSAVAYCHKAGVLHRDIKSTNVFLTKDNMVRLGDFGVSKVLEEGAMAHTTIGTPYYMSPEICEGRPYSASSDMWALGCVLYEMCALRHPFKGDTLMSLIMSIVKDSPPPISSRYSAHVRGLLDNLLSKDATDRMSADLVMRMPVVAKRLKVLDAAAAASAAPSSRLSTSTSAAADVTTLTGASSTAAAAAAPSIVHAEHVVVTAMSASAVAGDDIESLPATPTVIDDVPETAGGDASDGCTSTGLRRLQQHSSATTVAVGGSGAVDIAAAAGTALGGHSGRATHLHADASTAAGSMPFTGALQHMPMSPLPAGVPPSAAAAPPTPSTSTPHGRGRGPADVAPVVRSPDGYATVLVSCDVAAGIAGGSSGSSRRDATHHTASGWAAVPHARSSRPSPAATSAPTSPPTAAVTESDGLPPRAPMVHTPSPVTVVRRGLAPLRVDERGSFPMPALGSSTPRTPGGHALPALARVQTPRGGGAARMGSGVVVVGAVPLAREGSVSSMRNVVYSSRQPSGSSVDVSGGAGGSSMVVGRGMPSCFSRGALHQVDVAGPGTPSRGGMGASRSPATAGISSILRSARLETDDSAQSRFNSADDARGIQVGGSSTDNDDDDARAEVVSVHDSDADDNDAEHGDGRTSRASVQSTRSRFSRQESRAGPGSWASARTDTQHSGARDDTDDDSNSSGVESVRSLTSVATDRRYLPSGGATETPVISVGRNAGNAAAAHAGHMHAAVTRGSFRSAPTSVEDAAAHGYGRHGGAFASAADGGQDAAVGRVRTTPSVLAGRQVSESHAARYLVCGHDSAGRAATTGDAAALLEGPITRSAPLGFKRIGESSSIDAAIAATVAAARAGPVTASPVPRFHLSRGWNVDDPVASGGREGDGRATTEAAVSFSRVSPPTRLAPLLMRGGLSAGSTTMTASLPLAQASLDQPRSSSSSPLKRARTAAAAAFAGAAAVAAAGTAAGTDAASTRADDSAAALHIAVPATSGSSGAVDPRSAFSSPLVEVGSPMPVARQARLHPLRTAAANKAASQSRLQRRMLQLQAKVGDDFDAVYHAAAAMVKCSSSDRAESHRELLLQACAALPCCSGSASPAVDPEELADELEAIVLMEQSLYARADTANAAGAGGETA